jgi:tetratricopeptide (TPR) repeat protein
VLEHDLALAPAEPLLLVALAETRLYQAIASRDVDGDRAKAQRWLNQAGKLADRLGENHRLRAPLRNALNRFSRLQLRNQITGSLAAGLWPMGAGRGAIFPETLLSVGGMETVFGRAPGPEGEGGWRSEGSSPPPEAMGNSPQGTLYSPAVRTMPSTGSSPAPVELLPPTPVPWPDAPGPGAPSPEEQLAQEAAALAQVRAYLAAHPADPVAADRLGSLLAPPAPRRRRRQPSELEDPRRRERLEEAAKVYRRAAETSRLLVFRAAFYQAAARIYLRLEDWEQQHEMLKLATRFAPFASELWTDLAKSALRTANIEENQMAVARAKKKTLPALGIAFVDRPAGELPPGGPGQPPSGSGEGFSR